jgi:outer membrane protein TolC
LYGGVTIGFPVKDGGEAAAQIEALSKELEVTKFDQQALIQEVALAEKNWVEFLKYYLLQNELLKERVAISEQSLEELELRLKAGRADVSKLAREILSKAQSEIALVQLKARYLREKVNAESVTGQTCSLFSLCGKIKNSLPTN